MIIQRWKLLSGGLRLFVSTSVFRPKKRNSGRHGSIIMDTTFTCFKSFSDCDRFVTLTSSVHKRSKNEEINTELTGVVYSRSQFGKTLRKSSPTTNITSWTQLACSWLNDFTLESKINSSMNFFGKTSQYSAGTSEGHGSVTWTRGHLPRVLQIFWTEINPWPSRVQFTKVHKINR